MGTHIEEKEILDLVLSTARDLGYEIEGDSPLVSRESQLDSLAIMSVFFSIEQAVEDRTGRQISFNVRSMDDGRFSTVAAFVSFACQLANGLVEARPA